MKTEQRGISRIDSGSTHGWFVRGYKNKKTYAKLFSDKKYGGKRKGLIAAKAFKTELVLELAKLRTPKKPRRIVTTDCRNKTGVLGVCRMEKQGVSGEIYASYSVTWRPKPGVQKCTSFSVRKYGEKKALELAIKLRQTKMQGILNKVKKT